MKFSMKFAIDVLPRDVILDTQGRAVEETLRQRSFELNSCRVGKHIVVDVVAENEKQGREQVQKMVEYLLVNPLIETYEIKRVET